MATHDDTWTIGEVAEYLGTPSTGSARRTLSRWGVKAVYYAPGPNGRIQAHYNAQAVRDAHAGRPGQGKRTGRTN
ncbi:hypothetical protein [Streptomyces sp. 5-6(2022)]|uniref:hypothetical protein n=1 Tax=Streptomyces sp. 5-6(2022) TaxID=2936510 RepID=UPI0023B9C6F8|nr:hypothetical protein [Streptomyces sp. 5-6(2022)]